MLVYAVMKAFLIAYLLVALVLCAGMLVFSLQRPDRKKALYFTITTIALSLYVTGYLLEVMSPTVDAVITALRFENLGIPLIAPAFMLTITALFNEKLVKRWMLPVVLVYTFAMFIVTLTNDYHLLYYTNIEMVSEDGVNFFAQLGHGPLYFVQQACVLGCVLLTYSMLILRYRAATPVLRRQILIMSIWPALGFGANLINLTGLLPLGLDIAPFALALALICFSVIMFRYRLLDLVPIASTAAIEDMSDAIVVLDREYAFQYCNRSAKQLFPELKDFVGAESVEQLESWPRELSNLSRPCEVTFKRVDESGNERFFRADVSMVGDGYERRIGWCLLIDDITESMLMMRQLQELAVTDPLTGIYNRRHFMTMVAQEMQMAERLRLGMALIMYDLDNFKRVNDTYGHQAGDHVLHEVVDVVKNQLRPYDIFGRYGGEEFMIFTTYNGAFDLFRFAERLRVSVENAHIDFEGTHIPITVCFGAASVTPDIPFEEAMRAADMAMYQAKMRGRNQVVLADEAKEGSGAMN